MSTVSRAAHYWLASRNVLDGATVSILDGGVAASRRTAVAHHVADAAEITVGDESALAASWLCGGSTVDAFIVPDGRVDCVTCRLAAAVPQRPCVYYAWGDDDELLYVGSSVRVAHRIIGHQKQTEWWDDVRRLTFDEYESEHEARRAELAAIYERPGTHNREGRRGRFTQGDESVLRLVDGGAS